MDKSEYAHDSFASGSGNLPLSIDEYSTHYPPSGNTTTFSNNHESYATYSSTDRSPETIPTLFGHLHQQFQFQSPAAIEVDKLKDNLYRTRSWKKSPPDEFRPQQPSTKCQFPSAISSRSAPFYHSDRWPNDSSDSYRSLQTRAKRNSSGDAASASPNYDFSEEEDMKMKDEKSLKRLRIYDTYISGGHKRRAASPNDEHMSWRRESSSYDSPQDHFASPPRPNSYPSTMSTSMHPTSITTANSSAQCLLVGPSPAPISHSSWNSPDTATVSADLNLPTSISNQGLIHPRNISSTSTFKITEAQELRETKLQGLFVCECCPRKPKRFGTLAELIAHKAVLLLEKTGDNQDNVERNYKAHLPSTQQLYPEQTPPGLPERRAEENEEAPTRASPSVESDSKFNKQPKPQTRPPDSERRTRSFTRSSDAAGGTGSISPRKDESAQSQSREPVTPDDFQNVDKICPFLLYKPSLILPGWKACFGLKKEISHIVAHVANNHGLIRGIHPNYGSRSWGYLASCDSCDNFSNKGGDCRKCCSLLTWGDDDFNQSHHGVVLCLRCYAKFDKKDMKNHMTGLPCRGNMDIPKKEKLHILYTTFCSDAEKPTTIFTNPSPRTSTSDQGSICSRDISGTSTFKITEVQEPGETKVQDSFVCECCPKKPERFETLEELNTHKAEKPYKCAFCRNYFKNQGDVERHKKSTHGRLSSWSCSALSGYESASHESTDRPGQADTCGYCGDEFPRSGCGPDIGVSISGNVPQTVTDHDRGERLRHLEEVHNFRKCKSSAKFPRADNFREHLKRIHAGTSGKWINVLINSQSSCPLDGRIVKCEDYISTPMKPLLPFNAVEIALQLTTLPTLL
ncbi:hypothetical protein NOF04DRAFT_20639 [Fusarium oxysporum II5]|uniref:C2H2-type domain-containing protein n=1 Tax=Fusarium odoratissimum (strain NRRL 54006) TaxID=1089451 RepID=X0J2E7_FUSO5|nr:uncharacterized protein FOIG_16329 [Fusarium odoratissimum NRRL 54006]EXL90445.1 hypothetical protein FOIG_16329 [Fusarium odoratissimum NRRL 54006]KAK2134207.1 hypothetical protein NOF04DRAFT_20639 [Fusarium oxysporum II5]